MSTAAARASRNARGWRVVPVAAVAWAVAAGCVLLPEAAGTVLAVCAATALVAVAAVLCSTRPGARRAALVTLMAAVAAASVSASVALAHPGRAAVLDDGVTGGRMLQVQVLLVGKVEPTADGARVDAVLQRVAAGERSSRPGVPVRLLLPGLPEGLDLGDAAAATGTAFPADPGDRAVLVLRVEEIERVRDAPWVLAAAAGVRTSLRAAVDALPAPGGGLVPGLAVGDTRSIDAELDADMQRASLTHLTAVSGANCALVVGAGYGLGAVFALRRGARVGLAIALLAGFVVLVSPEPSVVRAAAMAVIAMLALLQGRTGAGLAALSVALAVLLALDPWLALELGFALSAAATGALLVLAPPLTRGLERWMPTPVALAVAVPLSAQVVCGPLIVLIAPQLPLYGIAANLLAAPAAPIATVAGLLAALAAPLPALQAVLVWPAWLPAAWIASTAQTVADLPAALLPWPEGVPGLIALAAAGGVVAGAVAVQGPSRAARRWGMTLRAAAVVMAGALVGAALLATAAAPLTVSARWSVAVCDIGQGDAIVVRSAGRTLLVDTGPDPDLLSSCLTELGVGGLDLVVFTHFDLDHVGGAAALRGRVDTLLHGPLDEDGAGSVAAAGARNTVQVAAGTSGVLGQAVWRVLWPRPNDRVFPPGNDSSVVLDIDGGGVPHTLLLGDLGAESQRMLRPNLDPPYEVVKVAHHGSADQDPALYRESGAALALVSVGADNDYGHPRAEILDVLTAAGMTVGRTDHDGLILVDDEAGLTWWRQHPVSDAADTLETWPLLDVPPDAARRPAAQRPSAVRSRRWRGGRRVRRRSS